MVPWSRSGSWWQHAMQNIGSTPRTSSPEHGKRTCHCFIRMSSDQSLSSITDLFDSKHSVWRESGQQNSMGKEHPGFSETSICLQWQRRSPNTVRRYVLRYFCRRSLPSDQAVTGKRLFSQEAFRTNFTWSFILQIKTIY